MKCFALDESGDVVLNQNDIQMAQGTDLIMQKIRQVLRTNRGEWSFDEKRRYPGAENPEKESKHCNDPGLCPERY